jgi:F0F1-type ATP synthase epsilon subunit
MADETTQPETNDAEQAVQKPGGKPVMAVKVYAPFKVYFEGEAYSVSAVNDIGPFDILPRHHNFLCMLVPCTLSIETPAGQKTVNIHRALMHVKADRVAVFVDV